MNLQSSSSSLSKQPVVVEPVVTPRTTLLRSHTMIGNIELYLPSPWHCSLADFQACTVTKMLGMQS